MRSRLDRSSQVVLRGRHLFVVLSAVLLVAYLVVNVHWIQHNGDYIQFDVAHHLNEAVDFENTALAILEYEQGWVDRTVAAVKLLNNRAGLKMMWPRLVYAVTALWSIVVGGGDRAPFYSNLAFLAVWVAGAALAMRRLVGARLAWEGFCYALVLGLLYPATYGPMRLYGLDFPLACCCCLSLALLMATKGFSRPWATLAFGVVAGLSLLVKAHFAFYLIFALPYALWQLIARVPSGSDTRLRRVGLLAGATALFGVLAYVWLAGSIGAIVHDLAIHTVPQLVPSAADSYTEPHSEAFPRYSLAWWTYYVKAGSLDMGIAGTMALLLGLFSLVLCRKELPRGLRHDRRLLLLGTGGVMVALSILPIKDTRYLFPVFPFFALVSAVGLMTMRPRPRRLFAGIALVAGAATLWGISYNRNLSDRLHHELMHHVGWEEGNLWARSTGEERFEGMASNVAATLMDSPQQRGANVGFLVIPQGIPMAGYHIDLARLDAYRLKRRLGCVGRKNPDLFDPAMLDAMCYVETVDMRFYNPTYFSIEAMHLDAFVVYHCVGSYEGFDPPYPSYYGEPMPDVVMSRTIEEIDERLPAAFEQVAMYDYTGEGRQVQAVVYLFEK